MAERIKGQDTIILLIRDGEIVEELAVQDMDFGPELDLSEEQYIGESTPRFDETFKGYSFSTKGHLEGSGSKGFFALQDAVELRARRQSIGVVINMTTVLLFPNGDERTFTFNDVRFSTCKISWSGNQFITYDLAGKCSTSNKS